MMARLEKASLIAGWYEQVVVGDQAVTERRYRLTETGARLWRQTREFDHCGKHQKPERWICDMTSRGPSSGT